MPRPPPAQGLYLLHKVPLARPQGLVLLLQLGVALRQLGHLGRQVSPGPSHGGSLHSGGWGGGQGGGGGLRGQGGGGTDRNAPVEWGRCCTHTRGSAGGGSPTGAKLRTGGGTEKKVHLFSTRPSPRAEAEKPIRRSIAMWRTQGNIRNWLAMTICWATRYPALHSPWHKSPLCLPGWHPLVLLSAIGHSHRRLTPSRPTLPLPGLSSPSPTPPSIPPGGCANAAPGLSLSHCPVSGPHGEGHRPSPLARGVQAGTPRSASPAAAFGPPKVHLGGHSPDGGTSQHILRRAQPSSAGGGGGWHKASGSGCVPLAAPIGLSPLHIPTLRGSKCVLVVSTEPPDDLSCWTTPGLGRPRDGAVACVPLTRGIQTGGHGGAKPPVITLLDRPATLGFAGKPIHAALARKHNLQNRPKHRTGGVASGNIASAPPSPPGIATEPSNRR